MENVYLISAETVKAMTTADLNLNENILSYAIRNAQDISLKYIIGESLLNALKEKAKAKMQEGKEIEEPYNFFLYNLVMPFLAAETITEALIPMTFKLKNMGVTRNTDTNAESADRDNVLKIKDYYDGIACDKANAMAEWLEAHRKEFKEVENNCPNGFPRLAATSLYLG